MKKSVESPAKALVSLGFTAMEAEVYVKLLAEPTAVTGYKVAKLLGRPVANTYKAIESLSNKGAVVVDDGASRLCRAVAPDEVLGRLERRFQNDRRQASRSLARIKPTRSDDRVYHLHGNDQVFERCHTMLMNAQQVALADIFPDPLATMRGTLESTAARGVKVVVKTYSEDSVKGAEVFADPEGALVLQQWPGQWLNLVVDGRETLLAFLSPDCSKVHQAIWSGSPYLSCVFHSALLSEIVVAGLQDKPATTSASALLAFVRKYCSVTSVRGKGSKELLKHFQQGEE